MPYDWKTPFRYLSAFSLQYLGTICITWQCACNMSLLLGFCRMMTAIADDLKIEVDLIEKQNQSTGNEVGLIKQFSQYIQFHSDARQLSWHETFNFEFIQIFKFISDWSWNSCIFSSISSQFTLFGPFSPFVTHFWYFNSN